MSSDWLRLIDLLLEGFFIGFGLSVFFSFLISLIKKGKLKKFHNQFLQNAIKLIRIIGIIYFIYFTTLIVNNFDRLDGFIEDKDELYRTLFFISRSLLIVVFTQLFWFKRVHNSKLYRLILILLIFILAFYAPYIIERVIFFLSYFSRDFLPEGIEHRIVPLHLQATIVIFFIEKIIYFSFLVFVTWFISEKIFNQLKSK